MYLNIYIIYLYTEHHYILQGKMILQNNYNNKLIYY